MKFGSKVLGILIMLFAVCVLISSAAAVDLEKNNLDAKNFAVDTPVGSNFSKGANTGFKIGDVAWEIEFFHNLGNNSKDASAILYLKDSSKGKDMISGFIQDIEKEGNAIGENENYTIIKNKEYDSWDFLGPDSSISLDNVMGSIFPSGNDSQSSNDDDSIDGYMMANVHDDDYVAYLNTSDGQIIVISGDNLEMVKAMAASASFGK